MPVTGVAMATNTTAARTRIIVKFYEQDNKTIRIMNKMKNVGQFICQYTTM